MVAACARQVVAHFHHHLELWRQHQPCMKQVGDQSPPHPVAAAAAGGIHGKAVRPPGSSTSEISSDTAFDEVTSAAIPPDRLSSGSGPAGSPDSSAVTASWEVPRLEVFTDDKGGSGSSSTFQLAEKSRVGGKGGRPAQTQGDAQHQSEAALSQHHQAQPPRSPVQEPASQGSARGSGGSRSSTTGDALGPGPGPASVNEAASPLPGSGPMRGVQQVGRHPGRGRSAAEAAQDGPPQAAAGTARASLAQLGQQQQRRLEWLRQQRDATPPTARYFRRKRLPWASAWLEGLKAFGQTMLLPAISITPCNGVIV